jgi:hypothetical protein
VSRGGATPRPIRRSRAAGSAASRPLVCVISGSATAEMERGAPGADRYVEKVRVPERLEELLELARRR